MVGRGVARVDEHATVATGGSSAVRHFERVRAAARIVGQVVARSLNEGRSGGAAAARSDFKRADV